MASRRLVPREAAQDARPAARWVNFHVRLKGPEHEFLDEVAEEEGVSKNHLLRRFVRLQMRAKLSDSGG